MIQFLEDEMGKGVNPLKVEEREELDKLRKLQKDIQKKHQVDDYESEKDSSDVSLRFLNLNFRRMRTLLKLNTYNR